VSIFSLKFRGYSNTQNTPLVTALGTETLRPHRSVEYCDAYLCLFVCLSANIPPQLHDKSSRFFCARFSSCGVAICYVLPVFRMTSCLHRMVRTGDAKKAYTQSDSAGGNTDLTPRRIVKRAHQRASPDRGRTVIYDCLVLLKGNGEPASPI